MAEALTAFVRGAEAEDAAAAELSEDGAWFVANALVNLEICAQVLGKKEPELPTEAPR